MNNTPLTQKEEQTMPTCEICNTEVDEVCGDGVCKYCHTTISWEDCITGTFTAKVLLAEGIPKDYIKRTYHNANI